MKIVSYILVSFLLVILSFTIALVSALVTQLLWNTIVYSHFHQPQISYYEALVLDILIGIYAQISKKEKNDRK